MRKRLLWLAGLLVLGLAAGAASAQYVTLTGQLQGSNGTAAANYTLNFTPSQIFIVAGTGLVVNSGTSCATSSDGSVVGVGNPLQSTVLGVTFSGTLPPANYYVEYTFVTAAGETLASPEMVQQLTSTGSLTVAAPTSGIPSMATGMRVYIGTSSGAETLQGSTTGSATFTQSAPLATGATPPATNTTICKQVANDAGWPTGTGYKVSLTDTNGNTLPGYPMQWQLMGQGTTINLSNGLPYYNGVVYYPSPILASPLNHTTQSISGGLNFTGYWVVNVGRIGVGTSLPAWPLDVENGPINASGGYLYAGAAPANHVLLGNGTAYVDSATIPYSIISGAPTPATIYYQTVQANGTSATKEPVLNLVPGTGTSIACTDNPGVATNCTLTNTAATTTLNNVFSSRAFNTIYQNTSGSRMMVFVTAFTTTSYGADWGIDCNVGSTSGGVQFFAHAGVTNSGGQDTVSCVVPAGYYYQVVIDNAYLVNPQTPTLSHWWEVLN